MIYLPGLALALSALWFVLSGQTALVFLALGAFAVLASLWLSAKLHIIDRDASPWHRLPQLLIHGAWLMVEVIKSNIAVIAAVLSPRAVRPGMIAVPIAPRTDLGRALFANSITLTPGTVTVAMEKGQALVHVLAGESLSPDMFDHMGRMSARAADGKARSKKAAD